MNALPGVPLLRACDDPQLFGVELWPAQRERLARVEDAREHFWCLGRRSGKTFTMALVGLWCCLMRPELLTYLRRGERGFVVCIATNAKQSRLVLQAALSVVERSPLLAPLIDSVTEDEIRFRNGTTFAAFACSSRGGRGWPVMALLMDEAAHFVADESDGSAQTAERVWRGLSPATSQFAADARIVVSSTPWGETGWFADTFARAASGELPDAVAVHATTEQANPTIDHEFLLREQLRDPEGFKAEFEAQFIGSGGAFFDAENIAASVTLPGELRPADGVGWVAGLDPGFSQDLFGLCLVARDPHDRRRLLVGLARSWAPRSRKPASLEESREIEDSVLAEVAQVLRTFNARAVTDQYKAAGVVERLRGYGISVHAEAMTAPVKDAAFGFLRGRLNDGSIELYEHPELIRELRSITTQYKAGHSRARLPRIGRSHCDHAQALAVAVFELDRFGLGWNTSQRRPMAPTPMIANLATLDRLVSSERRDPTRTPEWFESGGIWDREF